MAVLPKFYNKYIATGNGILIFAILFAATIRILYFFNLGIADVSSTPSYLWEPIMSLFSNPYISFASSTVTVGIMAFFAAHINTKHLLIRQKTLLPSAFIILLFSCHPLFIGMSAEYISTLLALIVMSMFFSSYNTEKKQHAAFKVSSVLALSSLFTLTSLIYIFILWGALILMRSFNFKAFIASLVGFFIIYFPVFSFFLLTDNLDGFIQPFINITLSGLNNLPVLSYDLTQWVILSFSLILLLVIISNDYINRHKDKIKVRAYLNLLLYTVLFAIIAFLFLNINPLLHLFIILIFGSFLLSHFFALVEGKMVVILFYISIAFYLTICFLPFYLTK